MTGWSPRQVSSSLPRGLVAVTMLLGLSGSQSLPAATAASAPVDTQRWGQPGWPARDQPPQVGRVTRLRGVPVTGAPLWPGVGNRLDVVVVNPNPQPVVVTRMEVQVRQVRGPRVRPALPCGLADFTTEPTHHVELRVAPHASTSLSAAGVPRSQWPWVGMVDADTDQDGCQDARLVLHVTVEGRSA